VFPFSRALAPGTDRKTRVPAALYCFVVQYRVEATNEVLLINVRFIGALRRKTEDGIYRIKQSGKTGKLCWEFQFPAGGDSKFKT
jgi:hypothetical protein